MTEKQAMRYPIIRAFALEAWNTENNPWCSMERIGPGYIKQEANLK